MEESAKARENGERYAQMTAEKCRRRSPAPRAQLRLTELRINCTVRIIELKSIYATRQVQ
jgi:hypothetical protein